MEEEESQNEVYGECMKNHAASLGSYATDGCGEFTPDSMGTTAGVLQCAACGCHRNFHRKFTVVIGGGGGGSATVGRGVSSSSRGRREAEPMEAINYRAAQPNSVESYDSERSGKKRVRTKFTADQKVKMLEFAEKLGWRIQRKDMEDEIEQFCKGVNVSRQVFKVWMHNHKNSSSSSSPSVCTGNASSLTQQ